MVVFHIIQSSRRQHCGHHRRLYSCWTCKHSPCTECTCSSSSCESSFYGHISLQSLFLTFTRICSAVGRNKTRGWASCTDRGRKRRGSGGNDRRVSFVSFWNFKPWNPQNVALKKLGDGFKHRLCLVWVTSPTPQWWVFPLRRSAQLKSQMSAKFCHSTQLLGWSLGKRWVQQVASWGGWVVTKKLCVSISSLLLFKNISGIFVINVVWEELVSFGLSDISKQIVHLVCCWKIQKKL